MHMLISPVYDSLVTLLMTDSYAGKVQSQMNFAYGISQQQVAAQHDSLITY
jgi:hypothetical protein